MFKLDKAAATHAIFSSQWQYNFKKLLHCRREEKIACVACHALEMQHLKCCKLLNHGYTCNFLPAMEMQFQEIIALPSWVKDCMCSMCCTGNATSSDKLPKYCKRLIFWQFMCQQTLPSLRVAGLQFFCAMATQ